MSCFGCYISILANEIWFQCFSAQDTANPQLNTPCQNQYKTSSLADVGWGFCNAPGTCRADETEVSVPGSAPGQTQRSHLRESLQGCEQESGHARGCGRDRKRARLTPTPVTALDCRNCNSKVNAYRTKKKKKKHCLHSNVPCFILHTRETMHLDHLG